MLNLLLYLVVSSVSQLDTLREICTLPPQVCTKNPRVSISQIGFKIMSGQEHVLPFQHL